MKVLRIIFVFISFLGCDSKEGSMMYYHNGIVKDDTNYLTCEEGGWCFIYDNKGRLLSKYEVININESNLLNQSIIYDKNGDVDSSKSTFFRIHCDDTLFLGRNIVDVTYCPKFKENIGTDEMLTIGIGHKFNVNFSNINDVKIDTFMTKGYKGAFGVGYRKIGIDTIRGFFEEEVIKVNKDTTEMSVVKHKKFFEKVVYVKDTIE